MKVLSDLPAFSWTQDVKKRTLTGLARKRNPSSTGLVSDQDLTVGYEIESEEWPVHKHVGPLKPYWSGKGDGSLQGLDAIECVSPPLWAGLIPAALDCYEREASNYKKHFSWRCSTHIHIGLQDLTPAEITSLMLIGLGADNYLYEAGDPARRGNYNCRPASLLALDYEALGKAAALLCKDDSNRAKKALQNGNWRYQGTNWAALCTHGTLEFRHFPGEYRAAKILWWTNLIMQLVKSAKNYAVEEVYDLMLEGRQEFGQEVFGAFWPVINERYKTADEDWRETLDIANVFIATRNAHARDSSFHQLLEGYYVVGG